MLLFHQKEIQMSDKDALARDWKQVGDDMRVVMGMKKYHAPRIVGALEATINGICSLNMFGSNIIQKYR